MKFLTSIVVAFLASLAVTAGAVTSVVTNNAPNTAGGARFNRVIGVNYVKQVLSDASSFVWKVFNQPNPADRKPVTTITLTLVPNIPGGNFAAVTTGDHIQLNAAFISWDSGNVKTDMTSVLYHEVAHVWQWNGNNTAGRGLIEGMADFVRLKAGYAPPNWVKPGQGNRWDQGYDVTARFLDYCDSLRPGFVAMLNAKMKSSYSDDFFQQILEKSIQQLWNDYKAKYRA